MRTFIGLLAAGVGVLLIWAVAGPAGAQDDIVIPPSSSGSGTPGSIVEVARVTVPTELVGQTCAIDFI
ncbi:MAG: hypothetical protein OES57_18550, partial [Acidimicrobiia bacterium]|nr:hypothetical protein [Acidimicrobiia bacterium]